MNKKILIGVIISIIILVGVSFTSVVGYNSIESNIRVSPLFNIRSSRAIDEENKDIVCEYVGKGDGINLLIPDRDDKTTIIEMFYNKINNMDYKSINEFINSIIRDTKQRKINENKLTDIINVLNRIKNNQELDEFIHLASWNEPRCTGAPCTRGAWFPGCFITYSIVLFIALFSLLEIGTFICTKTACAP